MGHRRVLLQRQRVPAAADDAAAKFDDGWLRTGDVGLMTHDGFIKLTDRSKDVIKSGGEWISSVDLENQLMGHPDVVEASVVGVPDEKWDERPLAAVVLRDGCLAIGRGPAGVPVGQDRQMAAAGTLDVRRRGAQDQRRQVRQEGAAAEVRRRRPGGRHRLVS